MINSRLVEDLLPQVAEKARALEAAAMAEGIDIVITSTFRDKESQDSLYAQGRTRPGKRVTNAKGGDSMHQYRVAFDFVPAVDGRARWDDDKLFLKVGQLGESLGLEWGGRWKSFPDRPHFQMTNGLTIADLKAGKQPFKEN